MIGASAPGALELVTLVVAIVGAITGIAALVIEAILFQRSGPRISVDLRQAWAGNGGVITAAIANGLAPTPPTTSGMVGYSGFFWAIKVTNSGRAATTIERVEIDVGGKATLFSPQPPFGPGYPRRLEAESSETWYGDMQQVVAAVEPTAAVLGGSRSIRGVAELGSGRKAYGVWHAV